MADEQEARTTKGILESAANAYEPSFHTISNPFNTQATRDVAQGKPGIIGNAKAGDKVYNPNTKVRNAITQRLEKRFKSFKKESKSGALRPPTG